MKQFILPIALMSVAVICLSIVHIDNINRLDNQYNELRKKENVNIDSITNSDVIHTEQSNTK